MRPLIFISWLAVCLILNACAASRPSVQPTAAEDIEWPSGPGTIPPSWYDYNPAYLHWYSPWFSNPEIPR